MLRDEDGNERTPGELVDFLYQNLLGREADEEGRDFYVEGLEDGTFTKIAIVQHMIDGMDEGGEDYVTFDNRVEAANYFTDKVYDNSKVYQSDDIMDARALLSAIDDTSASVSKAKNDADQWVIQQDRNPPEPPTAENIFTLTHINPDVNTWTEVDTTLMWTDGEKSINAATMLTFLEELVGNDLIDWSLISVDEQGIVGPDDQTTFKQILKDIDISIEKIEEPLLNEDGSPITIEELMVIKKRFIR